MPVCPNCKTEQKRRKDGACPNCGTAVETHGGYWYRKSIGSPTVALIERFEKRVSEKLSHGRVAPVSFVIPRKSARYARELKLAERLLQGVEGDYDLVIEAMDILFYDPRFNWKNRNSLLNLQGDYDVALALARSNREQRAEVAAKTQRAIQRVLEAENIFTSTL